MTTIDRNRVGRPDAARAVWRHRRSGPHQDDAGALRRTGIVRAVVAFLVGAAFFYFAHLILAAVVGTIGLVTLVAALVSPVRGYGAIHRFGERFGVGVGRLLGFVLMPLLFFLVITPLAFILRLQRRDAMRRRPAGTTDWIRRDDPERTLDFYRRQF